MMKKHFCFRTNLKNKLAKWMTKFVCVHTISNALLTLSKASTRCSKRHCDIRKNDKQCKTSSSLVANKLVFCIFARWSRLWAATRLITTTARDINTGKLSHTNTFSAVEISNRLIISVKNVPKLRKVFVVALDSDVSLEENARKLCANGKRGLRSISSKRSSNIAATKYFESELLQNCYKYD